jgi:hypothetical protein
MKQFLIIHWGGLYDPNALSKISEKNPPKPLPVFWDPLLASLLYSLSTSKGDPL